MCRAVIYHRMTWISVQEEFTHTVRQPDFSNVEQRGLRRELKSVFCLSFSAIYDYSNGSSGDTHHKAFLISFPGHHESSYSEDTFFQSAVYLR